MFQHWLIVHAQDLRKKVCHHALVTCLRYSAGSIDISRNGSQNGAESPEAKLSDLAVGTVSQIGRGKHTTRNITLLPVAGGLLADTPGFNQPALEGVQPENLMSFFPEIEDIISE